MSFQGQPVKDTEKSEMHENIVYIINY